MMIVVGVWSINFVAAMGFDRSDLTITDSLRVLQCLRVMVVDCDRYNSGDPA